MLYIKAVLYYERPSEVLVYAHIVLIHNKLVFTLYSTHAAARIYTDSCVVVTLPDLYCSYESITNCNGIFLRGLQ